MKKASIVILFTLLAVLLCGCSGYRSDPYEEIISKYAELVEQKKDGTLSDSVGTEEFHELVETLEFSALLAIVKKCEDVSTLGYSKKDLNGDGVKELIIMESDYVLHALYTVKGGEAILLDEFDGRAAIDMFGTVYHSEMIGENVQRIYCKNIVDGELKGLEYGIDGDSKCYKIVDGVRTDIELSEKLNLDNSLSSFYRDKIYTAKTAGLRFIPISGEASAKDAPEIDLSSYDSIISVYSAIVSKYSDNFKNDLKNNVFDDMYAFTDDESYDTFIRLCVAGYIKCPKLTYETKPAPNASCAFGYAKKDIDGNGTEELILMTDTSSIVAIFTTIDKKPVLVYGARDEYCWIGSDGLLRIEKWNYSYTEVYFSTCSITKDGELSTEMKIMHDRIIFSEMAFKKLENGSFIDIAEDEYNELYDGKYLLGCSEKCEKNQYMKNHSELDFVRLFEFPASEAAAYSEYEQFEIVGGYELTVSNKRSSSFDFKLDYYSKSTDERVILEGSAVLDENGVYTIESDVIGGTIEFAVSKLWLNISESNTEDLACHSYLLRASYQQ